MSAYMINKLCHRVGHDEAFRAAIAADPVAAIAAYDLSAEERRALLAGEVGRLFELGAHGYLLGHLTRHDTFGITVQAYSDRMREAKDDRLPPLEAADYYRRV